MRRLINFFKHFYLIYKLDSSFKTLSYDKYLELADIKVDNEDTLGSIIERLCVLADKDIEEVERIDIRLFKYFLFKTNYLNKEFKLLEIDFDLTNTTVAQMADCEQYLAMNENKLLNAKKIVKRIYQIESDSTLTVLSYFKHFMSWRNNLYTNKFAILFSSNEPEPESDIELSGIEKRRQNQAEKQRQQWNWYEFIYSLAQGDILKMEEVEKLNFQQTLLFKCYEKIKNDESKNI